MLFYIHVCVCVCVCVCVSAHTLEVFPGNSHKNQDTNRSMSSFLGQADYYSPMGSLEEKLWPT